jgi:hypothetical protein
MMRNEILYKIDFVWNKNEKCIQYVKIERSLVD